MYAVVISGGKQYRVNQGDKLKLEKLPLDEGSDFNFDKVLMVSEEAGKVQIGAPYLESVKVSARVVEHGRHKKIEGIKFKRRAHHMKRWGHRQDFTEVEITGIAG